MRDAHYGPLCVEKSDEVPLAYKRLSQQYRMRSLVEKLKLTLAV